MPPLSRSCAPPRLRVGFFFLYPPAHGTQRRRGAETRRKAGRRKADRPAARPVLQSLGDPVQDRSPALRRIVPPNPPSVSSVSLWCIPSVPASAGGGVCEAHRRLQAPVAQGRAGENAPQRHRGHREKNRCRLFLVPARLRASALDSSFSTHPPMERRGAEARRRGEKQGGERLIARLPGQCCRAWRIPCRIGVLRSGGSFRQTLPPCPLCLCGTSPLSRHRQGEWSAKRAGASMRQ